MATASPDSPLHLWRSKTIDGFARAEAAIDLIMRRKNLIAGTEMLSAKVERLAKAKLPDDMKDEIAAALKDLKALLPIRNDIVHAPMQSKRIGEEITASFANPNNRCEFSSVSRDINARRFQALAGKISAIATKLETL